MGVSTRGSYCDFFFFTNFNFNLFFANRANSSSLPRRESDNNDQQPSVKLSSPTSDNLGLDVKMWVESLQDETRKIKDVKKAASLVCRALIINAWRQRRKKTTALEASVAKLNKRVEQLYLQTIVLRRLLDNENYRVGRFTAEIHRLKVEFGDATKDKEALKIVQCWPWHFTLLSRAHPRGETPSGVD